MKILKRISLRMRITLLSGAILLICSVILSIGASYNAHSLINQITLPKDPSSYFTERKLTKEEIESITGDEGKAFTTAPALTEAKKQFDITNIVILAVVSITGMGMVYLIAGSSLRPIHDLSNTVSAITEDNLQERISYENGNDEVGALGHSFNIMLDRLENSFLRQKRFSANVAHELKTPLATINAGIQVLHLEKNPAVSEYEETLATTERNVKRLMEVVDDLLNLYEQEGLVTAPIDLQDMLASVLRELRQVLEDKHIETELSCKLKSISGNQILLYRACFNLVENAVKYNKDGGRISVKTEREAGVGRIVVSDTGHGIPTEELQHIFEPFYRVNKSRSRKTGGAGLGLSIVKAVVEKHGWEISVDSELEKGSTFTITFAV